MIIADFPFEGNPKIGGLHIPSRELSPATKELCLKSLDLETSVDRLLEMRLHKDKIPIAPILRNLMKIAGL